MKYFIFNQGNNLWKIAASESDKNALNANLNNYNVVEVTDDQFNKVRLSKSDVNYDGNIVTLEDREIGSEDEISYKAIIKELIYICDQFLISNESHIKHNEVRDYRNYLAAFDTSTISFPLNMTWEEYCNNNSITFIHPLQIP